MFVRKNLSFQTIKEEIANSITHGIGFILSTVAFIVLLYSSIKRGSAMHIVSCSFYGASLFILYIMSTLYHALTHKTAKKVFRRLDHISIYFLIFSTYMPLALVVLKGGYGWTLFGLQCLFCTTGIVFKAVFGPKLEALSTIFYLVMGGVAIFAIKPLIAAMSFAALMWILLGGLFYTVGIIFFATDKKFSFHHTIWHLFVL